MLCYSQFLPPSNSSCLEDPGLDSGWDGKHHGEQDDAEADGDVDLALPLHLRGDPGELQRDVD